MPVFDKIKYPDKELDLLANRAIGQEFRDFLDQESATENYRFLDEGRNIRPSTFYQEYLRVGAPLEINVSGDLKRQGSALAGDWENAAWRDIIGQCREDVTDLLHSGGSALRFYARSEAFRQKHQLVLRAKNGRTPKLQKMKEKLTRVRDKDADRTISKFADKVTLSRRTVQAAGVSNTSNRKTLAYLENMAIAHLEGKKTLANTYFEKLVGLEPNDSLIKNASYKDMIKQMKRTGILPR